jgi:hypothetical protein
MSPWLVAVLTLMPLYKVIFLYSRGLPQEHWTTYLHFNNGGLSQSWLWFLPVLFLFDTVFWSAAKLKPRLPRIPVRAAVAGVFVLGTLYGFSVSMAGLTGWTKTFILDFQNERLLIYFLLFLLGAVCHREGVFDGRPGGKKLYIALAATVWLPMNVYIIVLLTLLFRPGEYFISLPADLLIMWAAFLSSMLSMLYLLTMTFRLWVNREGPLARFLNPASYSVYIIHMVVVGGIALLLLDVAIPSLTKYVILTLAAYLVSNVIAHVYRIGLKPRLREAVS